MQEAELAVKILTSGKIVVKRHVNKETGIPYQKVYIEDLVKEVRALIPLKTLFYLPSSTWCPSPPLKDRGCLKQ